MNDGLNNEDQEFLDANGSEISMEDRLTKEDVIRLMDTVQRGDLSAMFKINAGIRLSRFYNVEEWVELATVGAEHGNLVTMLELARFYKDEESPTESEPGYLLWLERLANDELVVRYLKRKEEGSRLSCLNFDSEMLLQHLVGSASYELGLYYRNSNKLEELKKAQEHFADALTCNYPSYPGPYVVIEILGELDRRISLLEKFQKNQRIEQDQIDLFKDLSIDELGVDEQIAKLNQRLIESIGEGIWNRFQPETKSCLLTAASCFYFLLHATGSTSDALDFSCVIVPLMKCLEYELRIRFYNGYIAYLRSNVHTVDQFFQINRIDPVKTDEDVKCRGHVIHKSKRGYYYFSYYNRPYHHRFTLGSFCYTTGIGDLNRDIAERKRRADRTVLDYCRDVLFVDGMSDDEIDGWLYEFALKIKDLPDKRNESAHGGSVMNVYSATEALTYLVLSEKILITLIDKCR